MSDEDKSKIMKHALRVAYTRCYQWKGVGVDGVETISDPTRHVPTLKEFLHSIQFDEGSNFATLADTSDADDVQDFIDNGSHVRTTCKGSGILMEVFFLTSASLQSFMDTNDFHLDNFTDDSNRDKILEALTTGYKKRGAEATPEEKETRRAEEDDRKAKVRNEDAAKKILQSVVAGTGNPVPLWGAWPNNQSFSLFVCEDVARYLASIAGVSS